METGNALAWVVMWGVVLGVGGALLYGVPFDGDVVVAFTIFSLVGVVVVGVVWMGGVYEYVGHDLQVDIVCPLFVPIV